MIPILVWLKDNASLPYFFSLLIPENLVINHFQDLINFNQIRKVSCILTIDVNFKFLGKLLWFSGAPGMGKSTSAQILARDNGFVYYEADAFNLLLNPFNSLDSENPSMETAKQKILKGPGAAERSALGKIK